MKRREFLIGSVLLVALPGCRMPATSLRITTPTAPGAPPSPTSPLPSPTMGGAASPTAGAVASPTLSPTASPLPDDEVADDEVVTPTAEASPAATVAASPTTSPPLGVAVRAVATAPASSAPVGVAGKDCRRTSTGLTPLIDLKSGTYKGVEGGLYLDGTNQPPATYLQEGLARAGKVVPLNSAGQPDPNGKIVLLSIGMSNARLEYEGFKRLANASPLKKSNVVVVNGAQNSKDAEVAKNASAPYWSYVEQQLQAAKVTDQQVQVVWLKEAIIGESRSFPDDARALQSDLRTIVQILPKRFPNLQLIYLTSRIYGGYATGPLNPEPMAYESGFAVKWLIEERIKGQLSGPWLAWGPYLWADGTRPRSDGLTWSCADFRPDGTHPSRSGILKVARALLAFFTTDPTAKGWFGGG